MLPVGQITDHSMCLPRCKFKFLTIPTGPIGFEWKPDIEHLAIEFSSQEIHFRQCYFIRDGPRLPFFDNSIKDYPNLKTLTITINYDWSYTTYMRGAPQPQSHQTDEQNADYVRRYSGPGFVEWVGAAEAEMKERLPQFKGLEVRVPTMYDFRTAAGLEFFTANIYDTAEEEIEEHGVTGPEPEPEPTHWSEHPTVEQVAEMAEQMRLDVENHHWRSRGSSAGDFSGEW